MMMMTMPAGRRIRVLGATIVLALACAWLASGCSSPVTAARRGVSRNNAVVRIECNVTDAELWVDDRFIANIDNLRGGIALAAGEHRLELRHDRYHTHYQELTVAARERRTLTIEMAENLP
jgi:hypothetical protein